MAEDSGRLAKRRSDRSQRADRLPSVLREIATCTHAWKELRSRFPSGSRPSQREMIVLDHRLLLRPAGIPGDSTARRGRPSADVRRSSVLGKLAHGPDPFVLRLYLTLLAVHSLAEAHGVPDVFASVPLIERKIRARSAGHGRVSRKKQHVTWANLAVVGTDDDDARRGKINRAVRRLKEEGLVELRKSSDRLGREVVLRPIVYGDLVQPAFAVSDIWLPQTFWSNGWCGLLTGPEMLDLLMLSVLPALTIYDELVPGLWLPVGQTTKVPVGVEPIRMPHPTENNKFFYAIPAGEHYLRATEKRGIFVARKVRETAFGIYEAGYSAVNELREMGLISTVVEATTPDTLEASLDRRATGSAAVFSLNIDRFDNSAVEVIGDMFLGNSEPWRQGVNWHPKVREALYRRQQAMANTQTHLQKRAYSRRFTVGPELLQ